ncbi:hypothetical protein B0H16DRAFT_1883154 [Mycena metata]|uniref:DUF6534 domain-containing protein n=1 Tax=Mycena metata TaxID=1033252 RepID=A0AAD7NLW9_9AGAR|nr:hypothetical protein B0H16DRAFT_1883154 [Mycena metata]
MSSFVSNSDLGNVPSPTSFLALNTLGALEIGTLLSYWLFGATTTQAYTYYGRFPNDSRKLKSLVALVWFLELGHAICTGMTVYRYLISDYTHPELLVFVPDEMLAAILIFTVIAVCVQGFFSLRIYYLSRSPYIPLFTCSLSLTWAVVSIYIFVHLALRKATLADLLPLAPVLYASWAASTANDLTTAATLAYLLHRQRANVHTSRTAALVKKIIQWTLETGVILSTATTLTLVLFATMPANYIWLAMFIVQARLYSNSFLASLHSRTTLRALDQVTHPLSSLRLGPPEDLEMSKTPHLTD